MLMFLIIISIIVYSLIGCVVFVISFEKKDIFNYNEDFDTTGNIILILCWPVLLMIDILFIIFYKINNIIGKTIISNIENFIVYMFDIKDSICEKLSKK